MEMSSNSWEKNVLILFVSFVVFMGSPVYYLTNVTTNYTPVTVHIRFNPINDSTLIFVVDYKSIS